MFAVRRILRNRRILSNYISTSSAVHCEEPSNPDKVSDKETEKKSSASKKEEPKKRVKFHNLFSGKPKDGSDILPKAKPKGKVDIFKMALVSSAEKVAADLGGDKKETKRDLLQYISKFQVTKEAPTTEADMKGPYQPKVAVPPLGGASKGLGIFNKELLESGEEQVRLKTWEALEEEELEYLTRVAPKNYYEELIRWTNEGKLWRFPIDNDQGLEREAEVSFTEHVFLEAYLEPWCPKKGPLRKFMELVLIGLAKNPYLTVEDKREHIAWFEKYFENKKKLLQELGAMGATKEIDA